MEGYCSGGGRAIPVHAAGKMFRCPACRRRLEPRILFPGTKKERRVVPEHKPQGYKIPGKAAIKNKDGYTRGAYGGRGVARTR